MEGFFIFFPILLVVLFIVIGYKIRNARKRKAEIQQGAPIPNPLDGWDATKVDVPKPIDIDKKRN